MNNTKRHKRLILFRHAKSAWPEGFDDHDRPLADRGRKAAPVMGAWLAKHKLLPDLVMVSTARRAQETWQRAALAIKEKLPTKTSPDLYAASDHALLAVVRATAPEVNTLMLVGHNPGMEDLAKRLMTNNDSDAQSRLREKFPTGAIAVLSFKADAWSSLEDKCGSLDRFVTPKTIG
ncbi:histidine phosphatase family protein [Rhizobium sp. KVB221]|uniref:Histidine phosphatase family protein n=1 Tax=Rhizobium setariae TaxID=2801340 RepID=A0A937CN09_9HYPH|nr:histidine phosphatase family protein [Rhizobium setariae]MBL0374945.1 histidine phosphatase family protein [Rhizobium setariae]